MFFRETRAEFYLVDLAVMGGWRSFGALYTAYPPSGIGRRHLQFMAPRFLFVEDGKRQTKLKSALRIAIGRRSPRKYIVL